MRRRTVRGRRWCERVGRRERRADEREIGCQMCRVGDGAGGVSLQVEEREREEEELVCREMKGRSRQAK